MLVGLASAAGAGGCDAPAPLPIHSEPGAGAPVGTDGRPGAPEPRARPPERPAPPPLPARPAEVEPAEAEPAAAPAAVVPTPGGDVAPSGEGWNDGPIAWRSFDAGLAEARRTRKPLLLVLHAEWCSHCRIYSRVFSDPRVVAKARELVMVRVDVDRSPAVAARFALDGTYVPRSYFLTPDGAVLAEIDAKRPRYRYFFDENDPASILAGMDAATSRAR
jgi:hypothetical protein